MCRLTRNNMPHFIFATPLVSVDHNKFQPTQSAHIAEIKSVTSSKLRCHTTRQKLFSTYQHFLILNILSKPVAQNIHIHARPLWLSVFEITTVCANTCSKSFRADNVPSKTGSHINQPPFQLINAADVCIHIPVWSSLSNSQQGWGKYGLFGGHKSSFTSTMCRCWILTHHSNR